MRNCASEVALRAPSNDGEFTHTFAISPHHLREFSIDVCLLKFRGHGECRTPDASAVPREV